jgi:hypothetical protein
MLRGMRSGTWNLLFGLVAIAFGASGQFSLIGTNSSQLLVGAGALVAFIGVIQLWRSRGRS